MDTNSIDSRPTTFTEGGIRDSRISTKPKPGAAWKDAETQIIPENRLGIVFIGLVASMALAALDQTIVATALPTIVAKLGGGSLYSWVGTGYLLGASALMPIYGKLSDITGRKPILFASILLFLSGSALCGAAQSMIWLVLCRVVQGMGGGGILSLVPITVSDIVPLQTRGRYGGLMGVVWGISCVTGPLLGGAFTDHLTWRWCFWINLPVGGVAAAVLFVFLNLNPPKPTTFREEVKSFDFIGFFLLLGGVVCLLIGFNYSDTSWSSARTIALIAVGGALLIVAGVYEMYTTKAPILPPRLFKTRTTLSILLSNVIQSMVLFGSTYYLPMYYQVLGSSATGSGVRLIPYSVGNAILSAISGVVVTVTGSYRPVIWFCWVLSVLSFGLMMSLSDTSNNVMKEVYPMLVGMGLGPLYIIPMLALQAAMPLKDMATVTAAFTFMRTVAGSVAIAFVQTIITTDLKEKINKIPNTSNFDTSPTALMQAVVHLKNIPNAQLRTAIIHAYTQSISTVWLVMTVMSGVAGIMTLFLKGYSLKSNVQVVQGNNTNNQGKEADSEAASAIGSPTLDDSLNSESVELKPVQSS